MFTLSCVDVTMTCIPLHAASIVPGLFSFSMLYTRFSACNVKKLGGGWMGAWESNEAGSLTG